MAKKTNTGAQDAPNGEAAGMVNTAAGVEVNDDVVVDASSQQGAGQDDAGRGDTVPAAPVPAGEETARENLTPGQEVSGQEEDTAPQDNAAEDGSVSVEVAAASDGNAETPETPQTGVGNPEAPKIDDGKVRIVTLKGCNAAGMELLPLRHYRVEADVAQELIGKGLAKESPENIVTENVRQS